MKFFRELIGWIRRKGRGSGFSEMPFLQSSHSDIANPSWEKVKLITESLECNAVETEIKSQSVGCEYLALTKPYALAAGWYEFTYEIEIAQGAVTLGVVNADSNQWLTNCNHGHDESWTQLFYVGGELNNITLILAGANSEINAPVHIIIKQCHVRASSKPGLMPAKRTSISENSSNETPLVVFTHIHKTAGISLTNMLLDNCPSGCTYLPYFFARKDSNGLPKTMESPDKDVMEIREFLSKADDRLLLMACHAPYGVHRYTTRECAYISMVRQPLEKCESHFLFSYEKRDSALAKSVLQYFDFDLDQVLEEKAAFEFMNDQTRVITGSNKIEMGIEDLQLAKEIISERYLFVGATEQYDKCIEHLRRKLRLPNLRHYRHNVNAKKDIGFSKIGPKARALLIEMNQIDIMLYDWIIKEYLPKKYLS